MCTDARSSTLYSINNKAILREHWQASKPSKLGAFPTLSFFERSDKATASTLAGSKVQISHDSHTQVDSPGVHELKLRTKPSDSALGMTTVSYEERKESPV